jgi:hypothetical protein
MGCIEGNDPLFADALVLKVREGARVVKIHALVATGANARATQIRGSLVTRLSRRQSRLTSANIIAAKDGDP